jgi:hypothetical protein
VERRGSHEDSPITLRSLHAEAEGNRTRLPALAGTPVLKTGEGRCHGRRYAAGGSFEAPLSWVLDRVSVESLWPPCVQWFRVVPHLSRERTRNVAKR